MIPRITNNARVLLVVASVCFLGAFLGKTYGWLGGPAISTSLRTQTGSPRYQPEATWSEGQQLFLVYIGSGGCAWSGVDGLPDIVDSIKRGLLRQATDAGISFASMGVALDWSTEAGIAHLEKIGAFDEIAVGFSWMNSAALKYIWQQFPGAASTPQLILISRRLQVPDRRSGPRHFSITDERVFRRVVGLGAIRQWLHSGTRVRDALGGGPDSGVGEVSGPGGF